MVQANGKKRNQKERQQPIYPGYEVAFGKAVLNGGNFTRFGKEEIAELLPKDLARKARIELDGQHLLFRE